jgi:NADPH-dependent F420 reductase
VARTYHTIAIIGGTGAEGRGLALRWARAGHRVTIGSRDAAKAAAVAEALNARLGAALVLGSASGSAAAGADVVVLTVPYAAQAATAGALKQELAGKILIDVTAPLVPPKVSRVQLPPGGSCSLALQTLLGRGVRVVSAFQNVSAHKLSDPDQNVDCDVLVTSDDKAARQIAIELAADAGLRGIDAGPLANAVAAESLTALLIHINRTYGIAAAGIRITGLK